jgi:hypothetical protein
MSFHRYADISRNRQSNPKGEKAGTTQTIIPSNQSGKPIDVVIQRSARIRDLITVLHELSQQQLSRAQIDVSHRRPRSIHL